MKLDCFASLSEDVWAAQVFNPLRQYSQKQPFTAITAAIQSSLRNRSCPVRVDKENLLIATSSAINHFSWHTSFEHPYPEGKSSILV